MHVPTFLWAYRMTCKKLTGEMPLRLVYDVETVMSMEYIITSLRIAAFIGMTNRGALEERLAQLIDLEKE